MGPIVVLVVLVTLDRRKWRAIKTHLSFSDDVDHTRSVAEQMVTQGLPVTFEDRDGRPEIRYSNRYARRVHAAVERLMVTPAVLTPASDRQWAGSLTARQRPAQWRNL